jgi:hypothetical protein
MAAAGGDRGSPNQPEHAAFKAGHGADPIAAERENEEAGAMTDAAGGGTKARAEGRLPVRPTGTTERS